MRMRPPQKVLGNQLRQVINYIFHNNLDGKRVRPQVLFHRQRIKLRNKPSPPSLVSGHSLLKTVEFLSFLGGIALHFRFATNRP